MDKYRVTLGVEDIVEVDAENESEALDKAYQKSDYPGVRWIYTDVEKTDKYKVTLRAEDIIEVEAENESEALDIAYQESEYPGIRWIYSDVERL